MSDTTLSLGPFIFRDFEIPSSISFGGRQRLAVHYLSTGRRATDVLGPDDASITFSGILSGPQAAVRVREIDMLRKLGLPLVLAWNTFTYTVLISTFRAEYKNQAWIPYRIVCCVVNDPVFSVLTPLLPVIDQALEPLNLMYNSVPAYLLRISDIRTDIASHIPSENTAGLTAISRTLLASVAILKAEQEELEASIEELQMIMPIPPAQYLADFGSLAKLAEDLQFLVQAQDCLGQAATYVRQVPQT